MSNFKNGFIKLDNEQKNILQGVALDAFNDAMTKELSFNMVITSVYLSGFQNGVMTVSNQENKPTLKMLDDNTIDVAITNSIQSGKRTFIDVCKDILIMHGIEK